MLQSYLFVVGLPCYHNTIYYENRTATFIEEKQRKRGGMRASFALLLVLLSAFFPATTLSVNGQQEIQEESEGDLEVILNGELFTTGQTITISGSIDDPGDQPLLGIEVV